MILDQDCGVNGVGRFKGQGTILDMCSWCIMESSNTRKVGVNVALCTSYHNEPSEHIQYNRISHNTTILRVGADTMLFLNAGLPISGYSY